MSYNFHMREVIPTNGDIPDKKFKHRGQLEIHRRHPRMLTFHAAEGIAALSIADSTAGTVLKEQAKTYIPEPGSGIWNVLNEAAAHNPDPKAVGAALGEPCS